MTYTWTCQDTVSDVPEGTEEAFKAEVHRRLYKMGYRKGQHSTNVSKTSDCCSCCGAVNHARHQGYSYFKGFALDLKPLSKDLTAVGRTQADLLSYGVLRQDYSFTAQDGGETIHYTIAVVKTDKGEKLTVKENDDDF